MSAKRIIDDHLELANIGTKTHAQIDTHIADPSAHHTDHKVSQAESAEFKNVNIPVGEAYKQATKIILRIKDINTFIGEDAGKVTTGNYNSFIGYSAGRANTTGHRNSIIGAYAGYDNTTGYYNNFIGYYAGRTNTTGYRNNFIGHAAGYANTTGYRNNFIGYYAGRSNTTGYRNNFIGYSAGYYETGSNKLFIDNQARANEADGRIKALIYGIFDAATANQRLRINGRLGVTETPEYADNAAAVTGGLSVGEFYRTGDVLKVVH